MNGRTLALMREFDLLKHIYSSNSSLGERVLVPPGDDMAMLELNGRRLLAAVDQVIDGRHFRLATTPIELIGRKAVTRSLSDIAAMAGNPVAALAAATLPPNFGQERANALFDAMRQTAAHYDCPLVGGDLAFHADASHPLICSVTVLAEPPSSGAVLRSGAKPGDVVCVTGPLGGSLEPDGLGRHLTFEPRIKLAQQTAAALGDRLHAMIDISDGLGRDASHIAEMSGVQIVLDAAKIPCQPGCDWRRALADGEDYELCFAAAPPAPARIGTTAIVQVGEVLAARVGGPLVAVISGEKWFAADEFGWQHRS